MNKMTNTDWVVILSMCLFMLLGALAAHLNSQHTITDLEQQLRTAKANQQVWVVCDGSEHPVEVFRKEVSDD